MSWIEPKTPAGRCLPLLIPFPFVNFAFRPVRGLALIVVVGVLAILSVMAMAFVTLARLERSASQQRTLSTKALLLARSGLEDALARLALDQDTEDPANAYGGEDWNGNGMLDGLEIPAEVYRITVADRDACPVRHALRPSFYIQDPSSSSVPRVP